MRDKTLEAQQEAQLEGLAIGLEQRGEKSAAHLIRIALRDIRELRSSQTDMQHDAHVRAWLRWWVYFDSKHCA